MSVLTPKRKTTTVEILEPLELPPGLAGNSPVDIATVAFAVDKGRADILDIYSGRLRVRAVAEARRQLVEQAEAAARQADADLRQAEDGNDVDQWAAARRRWYLARQELAALVDDRPDLSARGVFVRRRNRIAAQVEADIEQCRVGNWSEILGWADSALSMDGLLIGDIRQAVELVAGPDPLTRAQALDVAAQDKRESDERARGRDHRDAIDRDEDEYRAIAEALRKDYERDAAELAAENEKLRAEPGEVRKPGDPLPKRYGGRR